MKHQAYIVTDLSWGDCGKGRAVDNIADDCGARLVIRHSGGAQCGHWVHRGGKVHEFSQLGSHSLQGPDRWTILSKHVVVDPVALLNELDVFEKLTGWLPRVIVSGEAIVATQRMVQLNRLREKLRGDNAHGTVGKGVGETRKLSIENEEMAIKMRDLKAIHADRLQEKLRYLDKYVHGQLEKMGLSDPEIADFFAECPGHVIVEAVPMLVTRLRAIVTHGEIAQMIGGEAGIRPVIFEGAQGILLDETFGQAPHTTWTDVTNRKAWEMIRAAGIDLDSVQDVAVTRTFMTRHGAGPFPTENCSVDKLAPDTEHNNESGFQGRFRRGWLDLNQLSYSLNIMGGIRAHLAAPSTPPIKLFVTHMDFLTEDTSYYTFGEWGSPVLWSTTPGMFLHVISRRLKFDILATSNGPDATDVSFMFDS